MNNLRTVQAIANRVAKGDRDFGRVYYVEEGDYVLLNYSAAAMYSGDMTKVEQACRGLVVRTDGKIMALPMPKFWNLGEPQCPSLPEEPYTIWEKIDGSLCCFWHDGGRWHCNTRGRLESDYVTFARQWWDEHIDCEAIPKHLTVMTEICLDDDAYPKVVHHDEGLYLIAARDNYSGKDLDIRDVGWFKFAFLRPTWYSDITLEELLEQKKSDEGTEGWVVRYDSGLRVKIKTMWYLRLFKAVINLTPKTIRQLMLDADQNWIDEFPDDLKPEALAIQQELEERLQSELQRIYTAYGKVAKISDRKEYAMRAKQDYPDIAHWLFQLRDGKFDEAHILERL